MRIKLNTMKFLSRLHIYFLITILVLVIGGFIFSVWNQSQVAIIENCKVINLQQQQLIEGSGNTVNTKIRYLVITENETFVCETSLMNGKFNNSDVYWHLKVDSTYTLKVSGIGKTFFSDYRSVLEIVR
jgi:hypothetical protein